MSPLRVDNPPIEVSVAIRPLQNFGVLVSAFKPVGRIDLAKLSERARCVSLNEAVAGVRVGFGVIHDDIRLDVAIPAADAIASQRGIPQCGWQLAGRISRLAP